MNCRNLAVALTLYFATGASGETIGIRFIVGEELGRTAAQRQLAQARLEKWVVELNGYYRNSEVALRAEIVQVEFSRIEAVEGIRILDDIAHERNGFADVFLRADESGADYTVAVPSALKVQGKTACGRAFAVNQSVEAISSTRKAFAVVNFVCGAHTLAHELGHLMGLNHGAQVDSCNPKMGHTSAIAPYANGYAVGNCDGKPQPGEFGDIMVGGYMREIFGNDKAGLPMFSNPDIYDERCGKIKICGDAAIGDTARALNENAHYYAMHEAPDVHTLHYASAELRDCINRKYRGKEIVELQELACPNSGISNIAGIERLTALKHIDLSGNLIEDVDPLDSLPHDLVESIDLTSNSSVSCRSLERLSASYRDKLVGPGSCRFDAARN